MGSSNYYSLTDIARMLNYEIFYEDGKVILKNNYEYLTFIPGTSIMQTVNNIYDLKGAIFENNGEFFAPLRKILELLGHTVEWEGRTNSIYIDSNVQMTRKLVVE